MRALLIAVVLVMGMGVGSPAEARRGGGIVIIVTGDDIEHIRNLSADHAAELGYSKLGYHYNKFGLFWLDLWRSDGEFVVYDGNTYAPITDDDLEVLGGASVPWRYHLPPLLLVIICGIELAIVGRRKRNVKVGFIAGGIFIALAALFYFKGLTWEFLIPGFTGLYHVLLSYWATKAHHDEDVAETEPAAAVAETSGAYRVTASGTHRVTTSGAHKASTSGVHKTSSSGAHKPMNDGRASTSGAYARTSASGAHAPTADSGPIPSRPSQPIVIERPSQPSTPPMRLDDNADAPKLLR